jgi:hypothetical protein
VSAVVGQSPSKLPGEFAPMSTFRNAPAANPAVPVVAVQNRVPAAVKKSTCTPLGAPNEDEPYIDEPIVKLATALLPSLVAAQVVMAGAESRHGTAHAFMALDSAVAAGTNTPADPRAVTCKQHQLSSTSRLNYSHTCNASAACSAALSM